MLLGSALAARAALVRLLESRIGSEPARAAALVTAILLPLHPAVPTALAELASRSELAGLFLGTLAGACFLRGRQTENDVFTALAVLLLLLAGLASPVALVLVPGFACAEYCSVRRHRKRSLRLRTSVTTALVFGASAWLPVALRAPSEIAASGAALSLEDVLRERALAFSAELGRVATAAEGLGVGGTLFAGLLLLLAVHPAFKAARHAPRLWGWILLAFGASLLAALAWASFTAHPWGNARGLFAALVWSTGLGLTITALARPWRAAVVFVVAFGWAVLAHAGARPWRAGSRELARLVAEVAALDPHDTRLLVLDLPVLEGLPPLQRDLGWLFRDSASSEGVAGEFDPLRVRALSIPAFLSLTASEAWRAWREERLLVLAPARALGRAEGGLRALDIPPARVPTREPKQWRDLTFDPPEPIDPAWVQQVRIVADLATAPSELERLAWLTRGGESGSCAGWVRERGGRRVADFDLSRSLAWQLAGSVRRMLVEKGERSIESGELVARTPELPGNAVPRVQGSDWSFARSTPSHAAEGGRFVLTLLDLAELRHLELALEPDPADPAGTLLARGAQHFVASFPARAPFAWALEYRVGELAQYRTRGSLP